MTALPTVVLKFGSSVLRSDRDLPRVVQEIYRERRRGRGVLAVVSAFAGITDRLDGRARSRFDHPAAPALAALLASGEDVSAAWLALALDAAGVPALLLDPARIGLRTRGPLLEAEPAAVDTAGLRAALDSHGVVVLPGFSGRDPSGAVSLLGRGGSDLTAVFLASRLGAECRLLKDVDGVYAGDPAAGPQAPLRFTRASWADAGRVAGELVQPRALELAARCGLALEVGSPGGEGTRIDAGPARLEAAGPAPPPLRVVLLGLGTVGLAVYRRLRQAPGRYRVAGVGVRDGGRERPGDVPRELLCLDLPALVSRPADVVVELLGGEEPATALIRRSLESGRHVVSANKLALARGGPALERLARARGRRLLHAAAVGGAVPMLERVRARAGSIERLEAVLNGTCNFLLDELAKGRDPKEALDEARALGFAEADPTLDLGGADAAAKLRLLLRAGFGAEADAVEIHRQGIEGIDAKEVARLAARGLTLRLIATARRCRHGIEASVAPVALASAHPLARTRGEENRLLLECADGSREELHGKGAGALPTALSVLADLEDLR